MPDIKHKARLRQNCQIYYTKTEFVAALILCYYVRKMEPTRQRPLLKDILGARIKIMWEKQLVDPPIATSVNEI